MRFGVLAIVGALPLGGGCYAPNAVPGAACSPAGLCPVPFQCIGGLCVAAADDARIGDGHVDSTRQDTQPDSPQPVPWQLVQTAGTMSASTLTIMPSGADHLIVVAIQMPNIDTVSSITDDASNAYVAVPNGRATSAANSDAVELWYAPASNAGATAITVSAAAESAVVMWEVANIRAASPIDAVAVADDQSASINPLGASITTTAADDFVVSVAIVANVITSIRGGNAFTNDRTTKGNGWAHLTNAMAPAGIYQAQWDQNIPGAYCTSTVAFFTATN